MPENLCGEAAEGWQHPIVGCAFHGRISHFTEEIPPDTVFLLANPQGGAIGNGFAARS
jgi:hypothetical protein